MTTLQNGDWYLTLGEARMKESLREEVQAKVESDPGWCEEQWAQSHEVFLDRFFLDS